MMTTEEILTGIKNWVVGKLNLKQNVISDLADIRSGAQAGATSVQPADVVSYFDNAVYDSGTHKINFYHGQSVIAYIDASPFIVDGMVDDVRIENGYLVIDFNTASGKQDISIPLTDIFNPNNYYTKSETDSQITQKQSEIDDLYARIGYYVCSTEGNVAAKTIVANNYTLGNGGSVKIKMTNANTVNNATLNINSTGAKALYYAGERASVSNTWDAGETVEIYYDGTSFYANNVAGGSGSGDGAFDVSVKYPTSGVDGGNTYTLEGALAVLNVNLPASKKKGGMSIKFVQSSDNKYLQYRLMAQSFTTDVTQWQGVDEEPVDNSRNLTESNGVNHKIENENDIYIPIPLKGEGTGYYNDNLTVSTNEDYRYYHFNISNLAGNIVRFRAGDSRSVTFFTYFCHIKLSDNSIIHLYNNNSLIIKKCKKYVLIKLPDNAMELYLSWNFRTINKLTPMVALEYLDGELRETNQNIEYLDGELRETNQNILSLEANTFNKIGGVNDIYFSIPLNGSGSGYYNDNLIVSNHTDFRYYKINVSSVAGKKIRVRAGSGTQGVLYYCHLKLSDDTIKHLHNNYSYIRYCTKISKYAIVFLPNNASELYLSWHKDIIPMVAYEESDNKPIIEGLNDIFVNIPEFGEGVGYYKDDLSIGGSVDYRYYHFNISSFAGKIIRLRAGDSKDNYYAYYCHVKLSDNSIIHLHNNNNYIIRKEKQYYLILLPNNASELYLTWAFRGNFSVIPLVAMEYLDSATMEFQHIITDLIEEIEIEKEKTGYDVSNDGFPVIPSQLFLHTGKEVPLYKNSMMPNPDLAYKLDINIQDTNSRKILALNEPSYFSNSDFGATAKVFLQRLNDKNNLFYKNIKIFHKDVTEVNGKTIKVMSLGDSLTQGGGWNQTPVTMLASELQQYGVSIEYVGTIVRTLPNPQGQNVQIKYEGRGAWRYRTFVGMESKFSSLNVIIPNPTKSEWVVGVDGTIDEIKANNPFLYPATAQDLVDNPDFCFHFVPGSSVENVSYSEDQTLADYVIFDPVRYFSMRNIDIPDVLTIALGTNEWYMGSSFYGGFDNEKATACAEFMIKQFRKVSQDMKIIVIPMNNFPVTRQSDWKSYCIPLCSNVMRVCDQLIANGDNNLFICPIYAQGSRWLGFNDTVDTAQNVSSINDLKKIGMDNNVHMLYKLDDSNYDYRESLAACVLNVID